jgi:FlaG/FlaF family flagellin (archaellin)
MKGIESIIAIILILMIVIALAALAYTWFSGVFASMTGTASTAVTSTTNAMTTQFSVDSAKGSGSTVTVVIRNTGTQPFSLTNLNGYMQDNPCTCTSGCTGTASPNSYSGSITLTCPATYTCNSCSGHICYLSSGAIETIIVTIGSGLQEIATVTC